MQPGAQLAVTGDELAIPALVAKHAAGLESIRNLVDQIFRTRCAEGIDLVTLFEQSLRAERTWFEQNFAKFLAGHGAVVNDPIAHKLVEARAQFTLNGYDEAITSLQPRANAVTAFEDGRAEGGISPSPGTIDER
jgi:hypothetical protein